jgi:hypothetical protein
VGGHTSPPTSILGLPMRYHLNSVKVTVPAGAKRVVDFGPESQSNVCENIAMWMDGQGVPAWTVRLNGIATAATGAYAGGVASKVWTEAGPLATMLTYPSVELNNTGGSAVTVTVIWTALIRQVNG